jgi:glycosyltransferase involved in cell wall biosynthesis
MAMYNLAAALRRIGHDITVLTMITKKHRLTYEQHKNYSSTMEVFTVHVEAASNWSSLIKNLLFSKAPFTASRFVSESFEKKLAELLTSRKFDIIQLEGLYLTPYIRTIRSSTDSLIALRAHNVEYEIWERNAHEEKNHIRKRYFEILSRRIRKMELGIINKYDLLIPITARDLDKFITMGNIRPAHVCPGGIDLVNNTDDSAPLYHQTFSLYFLGSLDWIPNQEGVIWFIFKVFPLLRKDFPDLRLHIGGRNAPEAFIRKIDLPGIVYHGEIEDARLFSAVHTVMIAPTFSGSGMRLKIIEAMANGKTVVTTSIGAEGLSVTDSENIMIADDAGHFQRCIEQLIKYPEICSGIGLQAMKLVKECYNNEDIASSLAAFYKQHLK